eukprot:TRINITY_DN1883_c0_g2_i1.p1 TRINITY_DN1883_c0_g2~~TRINITY_DN1883_c0_g2_i1.p1  ORF type:complete len:154 (-),score=35.64 TRINITY_DN1883_c0_g2_i1:312-773(-)
MLRNSLTIRPLFARSVAIPAEGIHSTLTSIVSKHHNSQTLTPEDALAVNLVEDVNFASKVLLDTCATFKVNIPSRDLGRLHRVSDIATYLETHMRQHTQTNAAFASSQSSLASADREMPSNVLLDVVRPWKKIPSQNRPEWNKLAPELLPKRK